MYISKITFIFLTAILTMQAHGAKTKGGVLASVGNKQITIEDIKSRHKDLLPAQKDYLNKNEKAKANLLKNSIKEEILVQKALEKKIDQDPAFLARMAQIRRAILTQTLIQKEIEPKLADKNIRRFYNKNKRLYRTDKVRAIHILLPTKEAANEVYKLARKTKTDDAFKELARKHSKDPSVARNLGDLNFFEYGQMVPEFSKVAFALKKGQISQPVKTSFGYHIIKMIDTKKGKRSKFKTVKNKVKSDLNRSLIKKLIDKFKKEVAVKINTDQLKNLKF